MVFQSNDSLAENEMKGITHIFWNQRGNTEEEAGEDSTATRLRGIEWAWRRDSFVKRGLHFWWWVLTHSSLLMLWFTWLELPSSSTLPTSFSNKCYPSRFWWWWLPNFTEATTASQAKTLSIFQSIGHLLFVAIIQMPFHFPIKYKAWPPNPFGRIS